MSAVRGAEVPAGGLDVGFVVRRWQPEESLATQRWRELALALVARGQRVHVVAREQGADAELDVRAVGLARNDPRTLGELARERPAEDALLAWVAEVPCDVVHVLEPEAFGVGSVRALGEMGRPLVVALDDDEPICPRRHQLSAAGARCLQPLASACAECLGRTWPALMPRSTGPQAGPDGGLANGDEQAAALRTRAVVGWLGRAQRLVVPSRPGLEPYVRMGLMESTLRVVEPGLGAARATRRGWRADGKLRVGLAGEHALPAGARVALEAFAALAEPEAELELCVATTPWYGEARPMQALVERVGAVRGATLAPGLRASEFTNWLSRLDLLLAPTAWADPQALEVRHARAAGLPVLGSELGVLPQLLRGSAEGAVLPEADVGAWTRALRRFVDDREWRDALARTTHEVRGAGSEAEELERLYREAIDEAGANVPAPPARKPGFFGRLFGRQ